MNILTVDVEDWFHILDHDRTATPAEWAQFPSRLEEGVQRILSLFEKCDVKGTFFVLGWVARNYPNVVEAIIKSGHEIGSHSDLHQLVYTQSRQKFENDLVDSLYAIAEITGKLPKYYRAPGFSITSACSWAFDILVEKGIEVDCSVFPARRSHGGFPSFPSNSPSTLQTISGNVIKILPMSTKKILNREIVYSGGGYFRLLPKLVVQELFSRSNYVMTYFHPRDFDPEQPLVPGLSKMREFKSYVGLRNAEEKLNYLLLKNRFVNVSGALEELDFSQTIKL